MSKTQKLTEALKGIETKYPELFAQVPLWKHYVISDYGFNLVLDLPSTVKKEILEIVEKVNLKVS